MMTIIEFLSQPFCQQLGLVLMHFLWQGLAVAILAAMCVRLFTVRPGNARYAIYLVAFAAIAACPLLTFIVTDRPAEIIFAAPEGPVPSDAATVKVVGGSAPVSNPTIRPAVATRAAPSGAAPTSAVTRLEIWLPWAVGLWMMGVVVLSVRLLFGFIGMRRWRRNLRPLPDAFAGRITRLAGELGLSGFSRVFISPAVVQATAMGYLRPTVLLPAVMLTQMDPAMIEAVVAHELAHVRRLDLWVNLAQRIVETLLFYHPAVWWLSNRLRAEREFCCDEMAVAATGERLAYASALETAQRGRLAAAQPALAMALGQGKRSTLTRVRHILDLPPAPSDSRSWLAGVIVVLILAILAVSAVSCVFARTTLEPAEDSQVLTQKLIEAAAAGDTGRVEALIAAGADVHVQDWAKKTALHHAAGGGHLEVAKLLITGGADVNAMEGKARTPLHVAAKEGQEEIARWFIAQGANVDARTNEDDTWTPLCTAASKGHASIVKLLLGADASIDVGDEHGFTVIFYGIWGENIEVVKMLIDAGADINKRVSEDYPYNAFVEAVWMSNPDLVKVLIDAGADVNYRDNEGRIPLHHALHETAADVARLFVDTDVKASDLHKAALAGDLDVVKQLIDSGVDVDVRDDIGWAPAYWALSAGQVDVCEYLLNHGADVAVKTNDSRTLLHQASQGGYLETARRLIAKGAEPDARTEKGETPLFHAANRGHTEICQLLVSKGADANVGTNSGRHPLGDAALHGHMDIVKLLITNGAEVDFKLNKSGTALSAAAWGGHPAIIDFLIAKGADVHVNIRGGSLYWAARGYVDVTDERSAEVVKQLLAYGADVRAKNPRNGQTALHQAAQRGRTQTAKVLIAAGADINAADNGGKTPLSLAKQNDHVEIVELLREHGVEETDSAV